MNGDESWCMRNDAKQCEREKRLAAIYFLVTKLVTILPKWRIIWEENNEKYFSCEFKLPLFIYLFLHLIRFHCFDKSIFIRIDTIIVCN